MNIANINLDSLNLLQTLWLTVTGVVVLTLTWMTIRLVYIGIKWGLIAFLVFLLVSPFIAPIANKAPRVDGLLALAQTPTTAPTLLLQLGQQSQQIALYTFEQLTTNHEKKNTR